ncbi:ABC transporter permease [Chitinophaga flava]|uniref:Macrolide ABC transporter permease n=1 Tax=Chitinophaga flava TaxID=2259036 RepID=A0A365XZF8_9BACT|nr:ABC transporter permease [Chitinophaga flava]RBL90955.1 macrolide ABC transporter permease [Chitinophaga flava]
MFFNYLKIACRQLLKNTSFSLINISGLAIGMAACMLLLLYLRSELSFDRHHQYSKDLYLINSEATVATGAREEYPMLSAPYAEAIRSAYPEVADVARLYTMEDKTLLQVKAAGRPVQAIYESSGCQADPSFFRLFSYQFLEGDASRALTETNSIVLSAETATKLFGGAPALNQTVILSNGAAYKVTGVYKDESSRSHINARFFIPLSAGWMGDFLRSSQSFSTNNIFYTYLRLQPGTDAQALDKKLATFMQRIAGKDFKEAGFSKRLFLLPVSSLHLYSGLRNIVTPTNSMLYLYIMASIALLILIIACVNFMNLSTARSLRRATEVGIRKSLGAGKGALIKQFLGESSLLAFLSLLLAIILVMAALPLFNTITGKNISGNVLLSPSVAAIFPGIALITGLLAGSYPAFYLSAFKPVDTLKGRYTNRISVAVLRRGLVVVQFVIAIGLILATLVIHDQMQFLRRQPLGFAQDQQIVIPLRSEAAQNAYNSLRQQILRNPQVKDAAGTLFYPGIRNNMDFSLYRPDQTVKDIQQVSINWIAPEFLHTMDFQLVSGRFFTSGTMTDTSQRLIVNEATLRKLAIPVAGAIGQRLNFNWQGQVLSYEIIGVVKDFHFEDLHHPIQPYAFLMAPHHHFNYLMVHSNTGSMKHIIASLENNWKTLLPEEPFEYSFLDEDFQRNYDAEKNTSHLLTYFTFIAIFVSCLGLFGLAAFDAQQRTKEIGVRKVLGASALSITALLSKDFLKPVLLAFVIASPLAYLGMQRWLNNFAYHTHISGSTFLAAGALAFLTALLTVSAQAIKASLTDPARSLRTE